MAYLACYLCHFTLNIHSKNLNIARIGGRFGTIRRGYFNMVRSIPLIGKQKNPFRALNGVSLEIKTGMFGCVGPQWCRKINHDEDYLWHFGTKAMAKYGSMALTPQNTGKSFKG